MCKSAGLNPAYRAPDCGGWFPASAQGPQPSFAQVVVLDECYPATFNAPTATGPDFRKNVAVGASTTLANLFAEAAAGTPDPNWDFEPDNLTIKQGQFVSVVDQGDEPHTFTEVKQFGGAFIPQLNGPGETVVPECAGGFSTVAVARARILQGSRLDVTGLSKDLFQCCIYTWMRIEVDVAVSRFDPPVSPPWWALGARIGRSVWRLPLISPVALLGQESL